MTTQMNPANIDSNNHPQHYLVKHDAKLKCICQICTCGYHHCPRPKVKGDYHTSYKDSYQDIPYSYKSPQPQQYRYQQTHYDPYTMKTSYQQTYAKPQVQNIYYDPNPQAVPTSKFHVPFVGTSSYKEQYKPFSFVHQNESNYQLNKKPESAPQKIYQVPTVKFQGQTSYKRDFASPPQIPTYPMPKSQYQSMHVPFYGQSSYKHDFAQYQFKPQQQNFENSSGQYSLKKVPKVKFQGQTSYKNQYKGYKYQNPAQNYPKCYCEGIYIPHINNVNNKNHIYYDPEEQKFY